MNREMVFEDRERCFRFEGWVQEHSCALPPRTISYSADYLRWLAECIERSRGLPSGRYITRSLPDGIRDTWLELRKAPEEPEGSTFDPVTGFSAKSEEDATPSTAPKLDVPSFRDFRVEKGAGYFIPDLWEEYFQSVLIPAINKAPFERR